MSDFQVQSPVVLPGTAFIDIGNGQAIPERVDVPIVWEGRLVTMTLRVVSDDDPQGLAPNEVIVYEWKIRDAEGVTSSLLRLPPFDAMRSAAVDRASFSITSHNGSPAGAIRRRRPRQAPSPRALAEVAQAYVAALSKGADPTRAVAIHLTASPSTAAKWVRRARDAGMLTGTDKGRAGGVLTRAAEQALAATDE